MLHQMKLSSEPFEKIARGEKVIESRLFDEKRQQIILGDEIEFIENDDFRGESAELLLAQIKQFYSDEDEQKLGVIGFMRFDKVRVRLNFSGTRLIHILNEGTSLLKMSVQPR